ncbi:MAG TPA: pentapeptide repeat-containing protein [Acidimicrobiia bacterium]
MLSRWRAWAGIGLIMTLAALAAGCSSKAASENPTFGSCTVKAGADCREQDLSNASLEYAPMSRIDLRGANLEVADLRGADLRGANFAGADLRGADLRSTDLRSANFTGANLELSIMTGANAAGAVFTGARRCGSVLPDGGSSPCAPVTFTPTTLPDLGPPRIISFRMPHPKQCINDTGGTGIEVEWQVQHATTLIFEVDGIGVSNNQHGSHGTTRLAFLCDNRPHIVTFEAVGNVGGPATAHLIVRLPAGPPATA